MAVYEMSVVYICPKDQCCDDVGELNATDSSKLSHKDRLLQSTVIVLLWRNHELAICRQFPRSLVKNVSNVIPTASENTLPIFVHLYEGINTKGRLYDDYCIVF